MYHKSKEKVRSVDIYNNKIVRSVDIYNNKIVRSVEKTHQISAYINRFGRVAAWKGINSIQSKQTFPNHHKRLWATATNNYSPRLYDIVAQIIELNFPIWSLR